MFLIIDDRIFEQPFTSTYLSFDVLITCPEDICLLLLKKASFENLFIVTDCYPF